MRFIDRVRFCVFIMAVTVTKMSLMVVYTVNTFIVFSSFTRSTNHTCSKMKMNLYFFYFNCDVSIPLHFFEVVYQLDRHTLGDQALWQIPYLYLLNKLSVNGHLRYQYMRLEDFCNIYHIEL
ncbi:hypothetical protein EMGBD3_10250 [Nitrosarchaeum sp.]|nr:hypothetical protein EMGBD3_10250 [Nitrosarchaeum sp.]